MKQRKRRRVNRVLVLVVVLLLVLNVTLGVLLTRQSSRALITLIRSRMLDISNTAAAMLDGDCLARLTAEDENTPEYREVMRIRPTFRRTST